MTTDAVLLINPSTGVYDISIDENGDIKTADFFDTSILYSIFGERRASGNEVVEPNRRRGWIGNDNDFENGSKLWLFYQARLTQENINRTADELSKSMQWIVNDGHAVSIDEVKIEVKNQRVELSVTIRRSKDEIIRKFFVLWELTGRAS